LSLRVVYIISPFMRGPTSRIGEGEPHPVPAGSYKRSGYPFDLIGYTS
jgi:hypothetical protein